MVALSLNSSPELGLQPSSMRRLFGAICVDEPLFRRAAEALGDLNVAESDRMYKYVLDEVKEYWDQYRSMPPLGILRSTMQANLKDDFEITPEELEECGEVLAAAKAIATLDSDKRHRFVQSSHIVLDVVIQEVFRLDVISRISRGDLSLSLTESQTALRAALGTQSDRFASPFGTELDDREAGFFTLTGNRLVDAYTGGTGPATGDIIGHAAPRGCGKSTCVSMVACDVAANERAAAKREKRKPKFVYIFNYEKVEDPLTHTLSYTAGIPRNTVEEFIYAKDMSKFSSGRKYKPYELERYSAMLSKAKRNQGPYPMAELGRFKAAREKLTTNLMIADFTGRKPSFKKMGEGFVNGIIDFIESHQLQHGSPGVLAFFIDYAGTCVRAHMRSLSRTGDNTERKLIEDLPFQAKNTIANPLMAFGWLAHQLAAVEADKEGGTRPNPNAFKDCKSFAENVDYAIVNGKPTREEGLAIWVQSKSRRGQEQPDQIAKLEGNYCRWRAVDSGYAIVSGRIMDSAQVDFFSGGGASIAPDEG